jgi:peptidoglycan hydrolase-like protein with peptidoglycan-binding domain
MAREPILSRGDTGDWVTYLQQLLEYHQVGSGFTAGTFDDATESGVRAVQEQRSIAVTGQCDEATWSALTATGAQSDQDQSASGEGLAVPDEDIAVSLDGDMDVPQDEVELSELEELPGNVVC